MRAVIDTTVFVGACLGVGACNAVVAACLERRIVPLMGASLLAEYEEVLGRESLFANCRLDRADRDALFDVFLALCEWTRVYFLWRPNLPDESDNHLVELAVAGAAYLIVTRNVRDLRAGQLPFPNLRAITPENFLKEF